MKEDRPSLKDNSAIGGKLEKEQKKKEKPPLPNFIENPDKGDKIILSLWAFTFLYGFALMPFKVYLLNHPWVGAAAGGGLTSMIVSGAHVAEKGSPWIFPLLLGIFGLVKFTPLFFFMGKKWGDEGLELFLGNNKRLKKRVKKIEQFAKKYSFPTMLISTIPFVPIPLTLVLLILGNAGMGFKKFFTQMIIVVAMVQGFLMYLGYRFGEPVLEVVKTISKYSTYITFIIIAFVIFNAIKEGKKQGQVSKA